MQQWPIHENNELVRIIIDVETETHRFLLRSDGTLSMGFDPESLAESGVPEYVKQSATLPGCTLIPRGDRGALRRILDRADAIDLTS